MATFTPPAISGVPPVLPRGEPGQTELQYRFGRHLRSRPEGIDVFILSDGTVTETEPDGQSVVWSPGDRNGEAINALYVQRVFYGGHDAYVVNAAEQSLLEAAGYTVDA